MLRLTISPDEYGQAALCGEAQSGAFSGAGEAWFTLKEIESFGKSLIEVSEYVAADTELTGGVIGNAGEIQSTTLSLRAYPIDSLGHFGVHVVLGEYPGVGGRMEEARTVSVELEADASALATLGSALTDLANGLREEAVLSAA